jgi:signal transduction histidine kinase
MLDIYETAYSNITETDKVIDVIKQGKDLREKIKLPFLLEQLPKALEQSLEGITKVSSIVQSMKAFSHPGSGSKMLSDINRAIENTVTVSRNEWKYECDIQLDLDHDLTNVPCFESELNQVILNLIVNAKDAIVEAKEKNKIESGLIIIRTTRDESYAIIRVKDNGGGIPDNIKDKIFDPFFTTKEVGKGTGQGLSISHSIIVEKHGGMFYFESESGRGTSFIIKLPLEDEE